MAVETDAQKFCRSLPKVELHAHLSGSLSDSTIRKLIDKKLKKPGSEHESLEEWKVKIGKEERKTLDEMVSHPLSAIHFFDFSKTISQIHIKLSSNVPWRTSRGYLHFSCFAMFKLIHKLSDDTEAVYMITRDVIKEFAEDGVKYLELRSTPREVAATGMTKHTHLDTIIKAIRDSQQHHPGIMVKFILAIDRRNGIDAAHETVALADEFRRKTDGLVVGVDLSGDPTVGDGKSFVPALKEAKGKGLKLALHLSEISGMNEETLALLQLPPDRIGHGTFIHINKGGTTQLQELVKQYQIPFECCMTSNVKGQTVQGYRDHHFPLWYRDNHPCCLCTDDKGVFATDLSLEYALAAEMFQLSRQELWDLSYNSIDYIFADDCQKQSLRDHWNSVKHKLLPGT